MKLEKGQKAIFSGEAKKYVLSSGQIVKQGEIFEVHFDVNVQDGFSIIYDLDSLHEEALKENDKLNKAKEQAKVDKVKEDKVKEDKVKASENKGK